MGKIEKKFNPLVSIVIPVYNGSKYMREAIDSALAQTYKNIEVIVVNDGSTDDTEKIAKSYGNKIRYFVKENGGVATALNLAIKESRGEYLSWLSHDDVYYRDKIESQVDFLSTKREKTSIVFGDVTLVSPDGLKIEDKIMAKRCTESLRCLLAIELDNTLNGCSLLIPRTLFDRFGLFDTDKKYTQDYAKWFTFVENGVPFYHINKLVVFSRQHEGQGGKIDPVGATKESDQLHSDLIPKISINEIDKYCGSSADFLISVYGIFRKAGYYKTSFRLLRHIVRLSLEQNNTRILPNLLNEAIFSFPDPSSVRYFLENQMSAAYNGHKSRKIIIIYSNVWTRGGIERVMAVISDYLVRNYDVFLVSGDKVFKRDYSLNKNITHVKISENKQEDVAKRLGALAVLLDADLLVGNPNTSDDFLNVYKLFFELNIKTIACNHGAYFLPFTMAWLYPTISKRLLAYKYSNATTWSTSFSASIFSQLSKNCAYMPNPNTFTGKANLLVQEEKIVLCVGRFYDSIKRLDRAILVFQKVVEKHPDAKLVLVGDYDLAARVPDDASLSIEDLIKRSGVAAGSIIFEGEQDNVEDYYRKASLLLLTSESEGFGMVLVEAGFFGLPCTVFDFPGLEDIIINGENGFIVEQGDIAGMADKVNLLLSDEKLRLQMGEKSIDFVKKFDQKVICQRWGNLIDLVLKSDRQHSLEEILSNNFVQPIEEPNKFNVRLFSEYIKNINSLPKKGLTKETIAVEEDRLFVKIMDGLVDEQKIKFFGSLLSFYKKTYESIEKRGFSEAESYLLGKLGGIMKKEASGILVTVIIPFYNRVEWTMEAIESALNQTHEKLEIIVVNDYSTENIDTIRELARADKRIRLIDNGRTKGVSGARNTGIDSAVGEYIAFLDSDDIFLPEKIERQLAYMVSRIIFFCHTSYVLFSDDTKQISDDTKQKLLIKSGEKDYSYPDLIGGCCIATPTVMIHRELIKDKMVRFPEDISVGEDICFWIRLSEASSGVGLQEALTKVRKHEFSTAHDTSKQVLGIDNILSHAIKNNLDEESVESIKKLNRTLIGQIDELFPGASADSRLRGSSAVVTLWKRRAKKVLRKIAWYTSPAFRMLEGNRYRLSLLLEESRLSQEKINALIVREDAFNENLLERLRGLERSTSVISREHLTKTGEDRNLLGETLWTSHEHKSTISHHGCTLVDFFIIMNKFILKTDVVLDIGCGIRPQTFFSPQVHICIEPFGQYRKVIKPFFPNNSHFIFLKSDALKAIRNLDDASVDTVFMIDLIEHLEKKDGLQLLREADRVARKQIIVFTPLGFYPMHFGANDTDAWGLGGVDVQEHKSGWLPEDFGDTYDFHICEDCHESFSDAEKKSGKKYSALMAIKTKRFTGFPSQDETPEFVKDTYVERVLGDGK